MGSSVISKQENGAIGNESYSPIGLYSGGVGGTGSAGGSGV